MWVPKFATGLIYQIGHSSKSIWVSMLLFCQNNSLMRESFWPNDSLITFIIFELCLIWYIRPVANFGTHPLIQRWPITKPLENMNLINFYVCNLIQSEKSAKMLTRFLRGWIPKFATGLIYQIGHSSKSIWVTRMLFCQNG